MLKPPRLYIMQTSFDGSTYTKGTVIDTYAEFNIVCSDFPFILYPTAKDIVIKDWVGEHGAEVYIPSHISVKDYDVEASFLYVGPFSNGVSGMRQEIDEFIRFLQGRYTPVDNSPIGARLAISEEYNQMGRKDVVFVEATFQDWWDSPYQDCEAIASFKVKFHVYDPITNVVPTYNLNSTVADLTWT